jgi:hypothetical protein
MSKEKPERVQFDAETRKWFKSNLFAQTTVMKCECCGLYFKPSLGHRCKKKGDNNGYFRGS